MPLKMTKPLVTIAVGALLASCRSHTAVAAFDGDAIARAEHESLRRSICPASGTPATGILELSGP